VPALQLDDIKQLKDYGLGEGAVLTDVRSSGDVAGARSSAGGVDYAAINALLKQAHSAAL